MVDLGRYAYGFAAIVLGVSGLVWHDFATAWQPIQAFGDSVPNRTLFAELFAAGEILGGIGVLWTPTIRISAVVLGCLYCLSALFWLPRVIAYPYLFGTWAGLLQMFSFVPAAAILYASTAPNTLWAVRVTRMSWTLFGLCVLSFGLAHFSDISATARLVPVWIPPSQTFWATATGCAFVLAAVAILTGLMAQFASRWLAAMLVVFGVLVWLPRLVAYSHLHNAWGGNAINLGIAAAAWIVADSMGRRNDVPIEEQAAAAVRRAF
jgi:uncharacterized membrane protein YphA (DoxX/SURF4 family)